MSDSEEEMNEGSQSRSSGSDGEEQENVRREPFDVRLPPAHQYLQLAAAEETSPGFKMEEADKVITVSILEMPVVLLPSQLLPFHTDLPMLVSQLREAARQNDFIAFKPALPGKNSDIATLIQVRSLQENDGGITVQAIGRQRCRILTRRSAINGMPYGDVRVLDEREMSDFIYAFYPVSFSRMRLSKAKRFYAALSAHSNFALHASLTVKRYGYVLTNENVGESLVDRLVKWLIVFHQLDKVNTVLAQGRTAFSYWVAANIPTDMETRLELLDEPCTDRRLANECAIIKRIDLIVCRGCGTTLSKMSNMINVSTEGNSALYVNPGGYVHDLFTVSEVRSTVARGRPSSEYSWFPGYKWTIHECAYCMQHVGWRFTSSNLTPSSFFGLTRSSIRPADSTRPSATGVQRIEQLAII
ncbi:Protein cereblon [Toxocara canis]|uniref:Protein cereblon n=1 Tax=Toxocara canis TaxID=6265 RepID=A0A0B2W1I4_TOXCA|nr:Protein cereblon [Toxocara canis]